MSIDNEGNDLIPTILLLIGVGRGGGVVVDNTNEAESNDANGDSTHGGDCGDFDIDKRSVDEIDFIVLLSPDNSFSALL